MGGGNTSLVPNRFYILTLSFLKPFYLEETEYGRAGQDFHTISFDGLSHPFVLSHVLSPIIIAG